MMRRWKSTVKLGDVWHDDTIPLATKANKIAGRVLRIAAPADDVHLLLDELQDAGEADHVFWFDMVWDQVYDWADANDVWIDVYGKEGE